MAQPFIAATLVYSNFGKIADDLRDKAEAVLDKTSMDIAAEAKQNTPPRVDTGNMMNGWLVDPSGDLERIIYNSQDYAIFNELGTSKMPAHPMLTPAVEHNRAPFEQAMKKVFEP